MADAFSLDIDMKAWERSLSEIGKRALPKAAAGVLNDVAFDARKELIRGMEQEFDQPTPFTLRSFRVRKTNERRGAASGDLESEVYAAPIQAAYLEWTIFGGTRRGGDVGAGPWDVPVPTRAGRKSKYGGVPRRYAQRLSEDPNVFWGELYGKKGYWRRPKRTRRKARRRVGTQSVYNRTAPKLLLRFEDETKHVQLFGYSAAIDAATQNVDAKFATRLAREIRKVRR